MENIYCGNAKAIQTEYGEILKIGLCLSDVPEEYIKESNGKKYINLQVSKRKEIGKYGATHTLKVDTWKPEQKRDVGNQGPNPEDELDLPF